MEGYKPDFEIMRTLLTRLPAHVRLMEHKVNKLFYSSSSLSTFRKAKACVELNYHTDHLFPWKRDYPCMSTYNSQLRCRWKSLCKVNSHWTYTSLPTVDVNITVYSAIIVPKQ